MLRTQIRKAALFAPKASALPSVGCCFAVVPPRVAAEGVHLAPARKKQKDPAVLGPEPLQIRVSRPTAGMAVFALPEPSSFPPPGTRLFRGAPTLPPGEARTELRRLAGLLRRYPESRRLRCGGARRHLRVRRRVPRDCRDSRAPLARWWWCAVGAGVVVCRWRGGGVPLARWWWCAVGAVVVVVRRWRGAVVCRWRGAAVCRWRGGGVPLARWWWCAVGAAVVVVRRWRGGGGVPLARGVVECRWRGGGSVPLARWWCAVGAERQRYCGDKSLQRYTRKAHAKSALSPEKSRLFCVPLGRRSESPEILRWKPSPNISTPPRQRRDVYVFASAVRLRVRRLVPSSRTAPLVALAGVHASRR